MIGIITIDDVLNLLEERIALRIDNIAAPFIVTLQQIAMLAIFIPVILGMSGNSGIQSLSVGIRKMTKNPLNTKDRWQLLGKVVGLTTN
nr:hypothetical protein [Paenibacillus sp. 1_12]